MIKLKCHVPNTVTVFGLGLGLVSLSLYPSRLGIILMGLSLICDICDGFLARKLKVESVFGTELDWHTDVALAHIAAYITIGIIGNGILVLAQAIAHSTNLRTSGRGMVFVMGAIIAIRG